MELQVVTSFFKIKREGWKGFNRTDEQYLSYFKVWAKLKNKIVVYVESEEMKNNILDFRESLGLKDKTVVNVINDCTKLEPELYHSIQIAATNPIQQLYRLYKKNPETWNYNYNYVTLMKAWCVADAIERKQVDGLVAWVDFGYNHGGTAMSLESNFNYLWEYNFSCEKMTVFTLQELDDKPMFDIFFNMDSYIVGGVVVGPAHLWRKYWELMKQSAFEMAACGLTDDEQNIILMAYRKCPQMFETYMTEWSKQLYQFGGSHLIWNKDHRKTSVLKVFLRRNARKIKHACICFRYAFDLYRHMFKVTIH